MSQKLSLRVILSRGKYLNFNIGLVGGVERENLNMLVLELPQRKFYWRAMLAVLEDGSRGIPYKDQC